MKLVVASDILNVVAGREYDGINAYAIALKTGLLGEAHVNAATKLQDDHKQHNEAPIGTICKLGGNSIEAKTLDEYAKALKVVLLFAGRRSRRLGSRALPSRAWNMDGRRPARFGARQFPVWPRGCRVPRTRRGC